MIRPNNVLFTTRTYAKISSNYAFIFAEKTIDILFQLRVTRVTPVQQ